MLLWLFQNLGWCLKWTIQNGNIFTSFYYLFQLISIVCFFETAMGLGNAGAIVIQNI